MFLDPWLNTDSDACLDTAASWRATIDHGAVVFIYEWKLRWRCFCKAFILLVLASKNTKEVALLAALRIGHRDVPSMFRPGQLEMVLVLNLCKRSTNEGCQLCRARLQTEWPSGELLLKPPYNSFHRKNQSGEL